MTKRVLLVILDGWGVSKMQRGKNSIYEEAKATFITEAAIKYPSFLLKAAGTHIGGTISETSSMEAGYQTISAGRGISTNQQIYTQALSKANIKEKLNLIPVSCLERIHVFLTISEGDERYFLEEVTNYTACIDFEKVFLHVFLARGKSKKRQCLELLVDFKRAICGKPSIVFASFTGIAHVAGGPENAESHAAVHATLTQQKSTAHIFVEKQKISKENAEGKGNEKELNCKNKKDVLSNKNKKGKVIKSIKHKLEANIRNISMENKQKLNNILEKRSISQHKLKDYKKNECANQNETDVFDIKPINNISDQELRNMNISLEKLVISSSKKNFTKKSEKYDSSYSPYYIKRNFSFDLQENIPIPVEKHNPLFFISQEHRLGTADDLIPPRLYLEEGRICPLDLIILLDRDMREYSCFFKRFQSTNPCFSLHNLGPSCNFTPLGTYPSVENTLFDILLQNNVPTLVLTSEKRITSLRFYLTCRKSTIYYNSAFLSFEEFFNSKYKIDSTFDVFTVFQNILSLPYSLFIFNFNFVFDNILNKSHSQIKNEILNIDNLLFNLHKICNKLDITLTVVGSCSAIERSAINDDNKELQACLNNNDVPFIVFKGENAHKIYEADNKFTLQCVGPTILSLLDLDTPNDMNGFSLISNYPNLSYGYAQLSEDYDVF